MNPLSGSLMIFKERGFMYLSKGELSE